MVTFSMTEREAFSVGKSVGSSKLDNVIPDHNFVYREEVIGTDFDPISIDTNRSVSGVHFFVANCNKEEKGVTNVSFFYFWAHKVSFYCKRAITLSVILWRASGIPPLNMWRVVVEPPANKVARCTLIGCDSRKEKTGASSGARINEGRIAKVSPLAVKPAVKHWA